MEDLGEEDTKQKHCEAKTLRKERPWYDWEQKGRQCGWRLGVRGWVAGGARCQAGGPCGPCGASVFYPGAVRSCCGLSVGVKMSGCGI